MGRVLGCLTKWLLPAALAGAVGYFVLGPSLAGNRRFEKLVRVGETLAERKLHPTSEAPDTPAPDAPVLEPTPKPTSPKVKVGVRPLGP